MLKVRPFRVLPLIANLIVLPWEVLPLYLRVVAASAADAYTSASATRATTHFTNIPERIYGPLTDQPGLSSEPRRARRPYQGAAREGVGTACPTVKPERGLEPLTYALQERCSTS